MYAVIETGGKQYPVKVGDTLTVDKMPAQVGDEVVVDKVLFVSKESGEKVVGEPYTSAKVVCEVLEHGRHKKVIVFKFKKRKDYKKKQGHRQWFTKLKVKSIEI